MFIYLALGAIAFLGLSFKEEIGEAVTSSIQPANWTRFDATFKKWGEVYQIPWTWLKAIAINESSLGSYPSVARGLASPKDIEGSKSQDGLSWGLMQVTIKTAKGLDPSATEEKLNNADYSIQLAAKYLKQLSTQFPKPDYRYVEWIIKSYNQGPGNTRKEIASGKGYANEYWERFQRNLKKVETT